MPSVKLLNLSVSFLREGDEFVAYTPALDLSTSGRTLEEAKKHFAEAVDIFFEETQKLGTLYEILAELGWQKQNDHLVPPLIVSQSIEAVRVPASL